MGIFSTLANSFPTERAFSEMRYVLHKHGTRLEWSEQSLCIYVSHRSSIIEVRTGGN